MLDDSAALRIYSAPVLGCPARCLSPQHVLIALDPAPDLAFHSVSGPFAPSVSCYLLV